MSKFVQSAVLALTLLVPHAVESASPPDKYPTKPIRLIVPMAAGGGVDGLARQIAQQVSEKLGQPVVVDNRTGGGGTIGVATAVRANPDGYTLIMVNASYGANPALYERLPYDSVNDIEPIIQVGRSGLLMSLHPSVPCKTVKEFIAYARANPGKLNYASAGAGGLGNLAGELFKLEAKVDFVHIPYKGAAPALTALVGGEVQLNFSSMAATIPHVKAGRLRALGVTTAMRSTVLPDTPTVAETVPGFEVDFWYGIFGAKGLPKAVVARWNNEVDKVLQTEELKARMSREGVEPAGGPPEQFLDTVKRDVEKWKRVVKEAGIAVTE
jgi:tripartite-type tricarboxylate transporter receptor subunit TctC